MISDSPIHDFFELSYAEYLAIPRTVLQSMPVEWQRRFVECLEQLDKAIDWRPKSGTCYRVRLHQMKDDDRRGWRFGPVIDDPLADYERGRRRIATLADGGKEPPHA